MVLCPQNSRKPVLVMTTELIFMIVTPISAIHDLDH